MPPACPRPPDRRGPRGNRQRSTRSRQIADASAGGRVVDKHQQGAWRAAVLKPPMLAAVDLHQLANAVTPRPRLVDALALLAVSPQPGFDHPLAHRFPAKGNPMILTQLLGRQRRAKIPVPLADDRQNRAPQRLGLAPVAAAVAPSIR